MKYIVQRHFVCRERKSTMQFNFVMILFIIYTFLILWIIPSYPKYRNCFRMPILHILMCLACAAALVFACIAFFYDNKGDIALLVPLLIVMSYVDYRQQEIPDFPITVIALLTCLKPSYWQIIPAVILGIILLPFALQDKIGVGDIKLMSAMCALRAMQGYGGILIACVIAWCVMKIKKESDIARIPFAPCLCTGFLITLCLQI